jgi:hypothetical protein
MFKIFSVYRHDIQNVQQDRLKRYDWLWKVLVYGSYLDFNFIKRLKEDYKSIQDSFEENTLIKQGIKRVDGDKKIDVGNIDNYYLLASLLNSKLFAYYVFNTSSTAGIMMEQQINDVERFSFPYIYSDEIIQTARKIEQIKNAGSSMLNETEISALISGMNENIYSVFSVSDVELSLLDYANNVAIPIQMRHKGFEKLLSPCTKEDVVFTDYANLFINRFASNFERIGKKFTVEIWHTQQIVGMFFKAISTSDAEPIVWSDKQNDTNIIFHKIVELGVTKITDQLFVQKDIRGFEKEYFYLFKPNEKRLWHKAIGYLDVFEFVDAILRAGRDKNE